MTNRMTARTKVALVVGFLIFVGGTAGAAFLGSRSKAQSSADLIPKVTVYQALGAVPAGTTAATASSQGLIGSKQLPSTAVPSDAVVDASQLSGKVAGQDIPAGAVITTVMFPDPQTRIGTVAIPAGKRALALALDPVPGVAGFVGAGDKVDIYSVTTAANGGSPGVRLVLQQIDVLNVNGLGLPTAQGQANGPTLVYLLAVTPAEAERLIYLTSFEKLYFDLVPKGESTVPTPGAGPAQALQVL